MPGASGSLVMQQPPNARDEAYRHLRQEILSGRIPGGSRLVENHLARALGVSRTPIREALLLLENEGLLESIPRVGYLVKIIERDEVMDMCRIREVNESLAAQWAAERMSEDEFTSLEENLACQESCAQSGDAETWARLDEDFHGIIAEACGSKRLKDICQTLQQHMLLFRVEALKTPGAPDRILKSHHHILEALKRRDKKAVARAVKEHMISGRDLTLGRK